MRAHQIMTRSVISITPNAAILEAVNTMLRYHVSGPPVVDAAGKLVGIVAEGDFIRRSEIGTQRKRGRWLKFLLGAGAAATDYVHEHGRTVSEVMTGDPVSIGTNDELENCLTLMRQNGFRHLPVCFEGELVGMVSLRDILLHDLNEKDDEVRMMRAYIHSVPDA